MPPAADAADAALLRHRALLYAFCRGAQSGSSFSLSLLSYVGGAAVATAAAAMRLQLQLRPLAARREKNKLTVVRLPAPAAVSDPRKLLMRCRILSIDIDCCTICSRSVERQAYFDFFCATTSSTAIPTIDDRCGTWRAIFRAFW